MSQLAHIVFVVDDDVFVRESLELLIYNEGWRCETFAFVQEFLARPRILVRTCLVVDVSFSGFNGLDLQKPLAIERTEVPMIFIADYADVATVVKAMKAGAVEFFAKPGSENALLNSIREGLERSHVSLARETQLRALRDRYRALSHREREVMALVASGFLNKEVGAQLGISEITVKAHRGGVMRKMQADSFAALVNMAAVLERRRAFPYA